MIGASLGALISGSISDKIGRKKVILMADLFFTVGAVIMATAPEIWVLIVGRALVGIGVGIASQIVPLYISEIAPVEIRGKLISFNNFMITAGQLSSSLLVFPMRPNWRLMLGAAGIPSALQFIGMLFMPESPRWLGKSGQDDRSKGVMARIYRQSRLPGVNKFTNKCTRVWEGLLKISFLGKN